MLSEKERLYRVLDHEPVDRPPCICPGGMMNMITTDLMELAETNWPEAHSDAQMMANLAVSSYRHDCFENIGLPFCMTIEAEAMGATINMGTNKIEPHVRKYKIGSVGEWKTLASMNPDEGRAKTVLDAIRIVKAENINVPIIGNVTGPVSTASSVMEPTMFYKELRRNNREAHEYMDFVTDGIILYARKQIEAGADVITVSDPSGTGEILGPRMFEEFVVKYINKLLNGIADLHPRTIVHICGHMDNVYPQANMLKSHALSFDSCVSMRQARRSLPDRVIMGNISTYVLKFGDEKRIAEMVRNCIDNGVNIISPACGIGTESPIGNIQAMLKAVKLYGESADA